MAQAKNYYQMLGVPSDSSEQEIKRAYRRLARQNHPDKAANSEDGQRLSAEFALISQAYNVLKDKAKREEYDAQLGKGPGNAPVARATAPAPARAAVADSTEERSAPNRTAPESRVSEASIAARVSIAKRAFARGMKLYQLGEYEKSVEFFEAAIKNKDDEPQYYARLAKALMNARRSFTRAREMVMKAIELDPYNPDFRMILAEICETAGIVSMAIQAYKDVLKWDAGNTKAAERLAALEKGNKKNFLDEIMRKFRRK